VFIYNRKTGLLARDCLPDHTQLAQWVAICCHPRSRTYACMPSRSKCVLFSRCVTETAGSFTNRCTHRGEVAREAARSAHGPAGSSSMRHRISSLSVRPPYQQPYQFCLPYSFMSMGGGPVSRGARAHDGQQICLHDAGTPTSK
jgi:hypothetical protein